MSTKPQNCGTGYCSCLECVCPEKANTVFMQPRDVTARQFALRKAHELIDQEEQQIGDASDGCGEDPGGADDQDHEKDRRMRHELELIDRLRDEADLCRNDGANDIAKLLEDAACAVDYFSANHFARPPAWVPCRIKLDKPVTGDFPFGPETRADEGEHDCDSNQWGAMSVRASNGRMLGVMPNECQIIGWRQNEKA